MSFACCVCQHNRAVDLIKISKSEKAGILGSGIWRPIHKKWPTLQLRVVLFWTAFLCQPNWRPSRRLGILWRLQGTLKVYFGLQRHFFPGFSHTQKDGSVGRTVRTFFEHIEKFNKRSERFQIMATSDLPYSAWPWETYTTGVYIQYVRSQTKNERIRPFAFGKSFAKSFLEPSLEVDNVHWYCASCRLQWRLIQCEKNTYIPFWMHSKTFRRSSRQVLPLCGIWSWWP